MLEKSLGHGSGDSTSCAALLLIYFFLNNRAFQQSAELLFCWWRREVIEWGLGPVAQTVLGSGSVASVIKRVCPRLVPVIFSVVPVFMIDANDSF